VAIQHCRILVDWQVAPLLSRCAGSTGGYTTLQDTKRLKVSTVALKMRWFKVRLKTHDTVMTAQRPAILTEFYHASPQSLQISARILLPLTLQPLSYIYIIYNSLLTIIRCYVAGVSHRSWRRGSCKQVLHLVEVASKNESSCSSHAYETGCERRIKRFSEERRPITEINPLYNVYYQDWQMHLDSQQYTETGSKIAFGP